VLRFILICLAGAIGTGARYLVTVGASKAIGPTLPYGTLIVNVVGCFLISAVAEVALMTTLLSDTARLTLTTGFLGGLTTYSSFNFETTRLLTEGHWRAGIVNLGVTVLGCFAAGLLGLAAARRLVGS
jgi:fluoride exporter